MTPVIYDFVADVLHDNRFLIGKTPQGDAGTRVIDFTVTENGVPYTFPSGATYTCSGTNAAGGGIIITCALVDGKIRVPLSNAMTNWPGIGKYKISWSDDSSNNIPVLSSFTFVIAVEPDPLDESEVRMREDFSAIQEIIEAANQSNRWIVGSGAPTISVGNILDFYLDQDTAKVYQKSALGWDYKLTLGSNLYIAYADDASGTNFSTVYVAQPYMGLYAGQASTQPTNPSLYTWIMISGGDNMKVSNYGGTDNHTVALADKLKGVSRIAGIIIPANTSTPTTTVTINNNAITADTIVEAVYTNVFGLNYINTSVSEGVITIVFPATIFSATAIVDFRNYNVISVDTGGTDVGDLILEFEDVDIDFSGMSV